MKLSSSNLMQRLMVSSAIALIAGTGRLWAEDTGWRQPGVRVWYIGATGAGVNAEEANLIELSGTALQVVRHSSVAYWDFPNAAITLPAPNPASEGPFWISPQRLRALHPPDAFTWQGLSLVVKARVTYQQADDLPFFAYLPVQALFQAQSPRELITLTGDNNGVVGDYFFDVETGLGLSSTLAMPGFYIMMMLAEINYDFATQQAFAEDDGPHTGYRASQMAGRVAWPINQFYLFEERVISRYGPSIRADLTFGLHNIATGQSFQGDYYSLYDGVNRQFYLAPIVLSRAQSSAAAPPWTSTGTHGFFWVPPGDLSRGTLRVWNLDLARGTPVGTDSVFNAAQPPPTGSNIWGFTRLQFAPAGFVQELTVQAPWMSFDVDSSVAIAASKTNYVTGRAYYLSTMGQAQPHCSCALNPDQRSHPSTADAGTFTVATTATCFWAAIPLDSWLHTTSNGTGPGTVSYQVDENLGGPRTGTMIVGSQTFTVNQAGQGSNAVGQVSLTVLSLKMKVNFPAGKLDTATLKAQFTVPAGASFVSLPATLNLGGVPLTFPLDAKGKGVAGASKLAVKVKKGIGTLTANLKGDWNSDWAAAGLTDETVVGKPVKIAIVFELASTPALRLAAQRALVYKATAGKSGQAK